MLEFLTNNWISIIIVVSLVAFLFTKAGEEIVEKIVDSFIKILEDNNIKKGDDDEDDLY